MRRTSPDARASARLPPAPAASASPAARRRRPRIRRGSSGSSSSSRSSKWPNAAAARTALFLLDGGMRYGGSDTGTEVWSFRGQGLPNPRGHPSLVYSNLV